MFPVNLSKTLEALIQNPFLKNSTISIRHNHRIIQSSNKLISNYIKNDDFNSAVDIFNSMPKKTTVTYNSLLSFYTKHPCLQNALQLFEKIPSPDIVSYNTLLLCHIVNNDVDGAFKLFDYMPYRDCASWNTMVSCLFRLGKVEEAKDLFEKIPEKNLVSWNVIVSGFVRNGDIVMARKYLELAPDKNDVILKTSLVTGYMSLGMVKQAHSVFSSMKIKNQVTWNAMIAGFINNSQPEEAIKLLKTLIESGEVRPNQSTLSSSLLACSHLSALNLGRQIHQRACKTPLVLNLTVNTSLLSMYCKCGDIHDAKKLFSFTRKRDVVLWNAILSGYAQHGLGITALQLFENMKKENVKPNDVTFVAVLSACNHAGLLDIGKYYFENMEKNYGVAPKLDHYSCMVDLLCRFGSLENAVDIIKSMPYKAHASIYGTLLGACRVYKNLEFAEFAAANLIELDPHNAGAYVQLANIYASMNMYNDVARVRKMMKENETVKAPGYSWIEIKGTVHKFRSSDRIHLDLNLIHEKLDELESRIKKAGYVPNLDFVLQDVEVLEKERMLMRHSEKLAIAYGLIKMNLESVIRVFKNLRVCGDCHNAIKLISLVEERDIVLRDNTRFHHFSNGKCSCGEYW